MKKAIATSLRIILPFALGAAILYWMYRGSSWREISDMLLHRMTWGWMLLSLFFGILPQALRGLRWRLALEPLGERPRISTCIYSIFVSYAASLVIPRIGEVTRCGTLTHHDGTSFAKGLGTVVTERIVDALFMLGVTLLALFGQRHTFSTFFSRTGTSFHDILSRFTATGYLVAAACILALVAFGVVAFRKLNVPGRVRSLLRDLWAGISSLGKTKRLGLYTFYSFAIWLCYYLQFSLSLLCFDFSRDITQMDALVMFCVGSYAVLIPTPNGAGPWHFAVKTMLILYGVAAGNAILFALVVHALQTGLIIFLGVVGLAALQFLPVAKASAATANNGYSNY